VGEPRARQSRAHVRAVLRGAAGVAPARHVRCDPPLGPPARPGAHAVLRHGADVLEAGDRLTTAALTDGLGPAGGIPGGRDDRHLGARRGAGRRAPPPVPLLCPRGEPTRRNLGARRSADRRRDHVGPRFDHLRDRDIRLCPSLAHAGPDPGEELPARGRALGEFMSSTVIPLAAHFLAESILTLVLPVGVVIVITIWYVFMWRRGTGER